MKNIINLLGDSFTKKSYSLCNKQILIFLLCIISIFALAALSSCKVKVIKLDEKEKVDEDEIKVYFDGDFDASKVIDPIWETEIIPYFIEKAVDINVLLDNAAKDPLGTTEKYGRASSGAIKSYNFIVKGTGNIISVNDVSNGSLNIDLAPHDNNTDILIFIGPVLTPSLHSIRDSYDGLVYGDVNTQLQWGDVGKRIKEKIKESVINDLDKETLPGKTVSFYGAFTLGGPDNYSKINITPIKLEIEEAGGL